MMKKKKWTGFPVLMFFLTIPLMYLSGPGVSAEEGEIIYQNASKDLEISILPLGWSEDGAFGAVLKKRMEQKTMTRLLVQDMVTDNILFDSSWKDNVDDRQVHLEEFEIEEQSGPFVPSKIMNRPWDFLGFEVLSSSSAYESKSEIILYSAKEVYIPDSHSLGQARLKTVWKDNEGNPPSVTGYIVSPFEDRAAIVATRTVPGPGEEVFLVGCHLTAGYDPERVSEYK